MSDDRGTETLLRAALEQHASTVEIAPDALGEIRARIRARRRARWIPGSARFRFQEEEPCSHLVVRVSRSPPRSSR